MFTKLLKTAATTALLASALPAVASAAEIEFGGHTWTAGENDGSDARVDEFLGRPSLYLRRNTAALKDVELDDLVIEYEFAASHPSGFIGVNFRADGETGNLEQFYTRPHQSGQPDATQYMVMTNGSATWQLHAGPNEAVETELPAQSWIKVRIVAIGDKADIFVGDMDTPLIHVPNLRSTSHSGQIGLYASDRPWMRETGAYFSNVTIRAATADDEIIGTPKETEPNPEGLIETFEVSNPFEEEKISAVYELADLEFTPQSWTSLDVENDGVANLSRVAPMRDGNNTVLVRMRVNSDTGGTQMLNFGYSDRVRLYVDGKLAYAGNAQWRARDHRFLGTIALVDSIALHLKPGENEIIAAVSESFGGWGFKAALTD